MAALQDEARRQYVWLAVEGCRDANGAYLQTPAYLAQQADAEYNQLSFAFRERLRVLIPQLVSLLDIRDKNATYLKEEYDKACLVWDTLSPDLQESETDHITGRWDELYDQTEDMLEQWNELIDDCVTELQKEKDRVAQEFIQNLGMRIFRESLQRRANLAHSQWLALRNDEAKYQTLSQTARRGFKIFGIHKNPAALKELCNKQVLLPDTGIKTAPWQDALDVLPKVDGRQWKPKSLGQGGMGSARVYTQTDDKGTVYDRVVVKDSYETDKDNFRRPSIWHGDITLPDWQSQCVPLEFHIQRLVSSTQQTPHVVGLRTAPSVDWEGCQTRLYMDYAPEGDLEKLIRRHQDHDEPIPEKFLWLCLKALVDCSLVMKQGGLTSKWVPWAEIVHCDLKPENIFLGDPQNGFYSQWPTPKVGDWGLAFSTCEEDETNPMMWSGAGTMGHMSVEQRQYVDSETQQPIDLQKILSPVNVYGLGTVIFAMMEQRSGGMLQPSFMPAVPPFPYNLDPLWRAVYSADLCQLVQGCLQTRPENRPSLDELKQSIDAKLMSNDWRLDRQGMIRPRDDTLLLPNYDVKLRWASRILAGPGKVNDPRVPRQWDDETSTVANSEEEGDDPANHQPGAD